MDLIRTISARETGDGRMSMEMRKSMYQLYKEGQLCDTKIIVKGKKRLSAHRIVLAGCSGFFRALFTTRLGMKEEAQVSMRGISEDVMQTVLDYIYLKKMDLNDSIIGQVLIVADYLAINGAIELCCNYLRNSLNAENCLRVYLFSKKYSLNVLAADAWQFTMWNFPKIIQENDELMQLSFEDFFSIVKHDNLNAPKEEMVWHAVNKWLQVSPDRQTYLLPLLKTVRLGLLRPQYFLEHVRDNSMVAESDECRPVLIDTLRFLFNLDLVAEPDVYDSLMHLARPRFAPDVLFSIGGWSGGSPTNCIEAYDVRADLWFPVPDVDPSGPRAYHGTVVLGHNVYVIGGYNGMDYFNTCRCFNTVTRVWKEIAPMNKPRCYISAVALNGYIYAMGGYNGTRRQSSAERYDPISNQWTLIASMNHARSDASATAIKGQIVIVGGFNGQECLNSAELYDPLVDTWTMIEFMNSRRSGVSCTAYNTYVYVLGGFNGINRLSSCEAYDPRRNTWLTMPEMPHARSNFAVGIIDDYLFAIGGFNGITTTAHVDYYDAKTELWFPATSLNLYRSALSACVVQDLPNIESYLSIDRDSLLEAHRLHRLQSLQEQRDTTNSPNNNNNNNNDSNNSININNNNNASGGGATSHAPNGQNQVAPRRRNR